MPVVPPMMVISLSQPASCGSSRSASARLLCAPVIATDKLAAVLARHAQDEFHRMDILRCARRLGQLDAVEAARAMGIRRERRIADERPAAAFGDRDREPGERQNTQRVQRGELDGLVAEHRRDADQVEMARRIQDRDRVVMARDRNQSEFRHGRLRPSVRGD